MDIQYESDMPIYQQIAEQIEDGILSGAFGEEEQVPSTTEISAIYRINPGTVLKGMTVLTDAKVLYKKRGIGMFVQSGARERIRKKRKEEFYEKRLSKLLEEAARLGIGKQELITAIEKEMTS